MADTEPRKQDEEMETEEEAVKVDSMAVDEKEAGSTGDAADAGAANGTAAQPAGARAEGAEAAQGDQGRHDKGNAGADEGAREGQKHEASNGRGSARGHGDELGDRARRAGEQSGNGGGDDISHRKGRDDSEGREDRDERSHKEGRGDRGDREARDKEHREGDGSKGHKEEKSDRSHREADDRGRKDGDERVSRGHKEHKKEKKERRERSSRRESRSRSRESRSRSRSRGRGRHKGGSSRRDDSRSRSRHRSSRRRSRTRSRSRDRYRRHRSRSYDRHDSRRRSKQEDSASGGEEELGYGGYRPRKRQEPAAKKAGVSAYHDPFFHLRQQNAAQDPQDALRKWQEQQLQARQLVLQQQAASAAAAASKSQRELYVGNLVPGVVTEAMLRQVFDSGLMAAFPQAALPGKTPVIKASVHSEGKYAFVEFRTPEYATAAMALSGQVILGGQAISIGRPQGYVDPAKAQLAAAQAGVALAAFKAGDVSAANSLLPGAVPGAGAAGAAANPLLMAGVPGVGVPGVGAPPAYPGLGAALAASQAPAVSAAPGSSLTGLLAVAQQVATAVAPSPPVPSLPPPLGSLPQSALGAALAQAMPTQFLCVTGMVNAETLADDFEYREVIIDLKDECGKSGAVVEVKVPRPPIPSQAAQLINDPSNNYGKAFVHFVDVDGAVRARQAIHGRMFAGSLVQVTFVPQAVYAAVPGN